MSYELKTERLRQIYTLSATSGMPVLSRSADEEKAIAGQVFDDWLARVKREAAAEAWREAAERVQAMVDDRPALTARNILGSLRMQADLRAAEIREVK
ncbi:hypothetical protein [Herbiconiux solani]|uniref:hypothetical protein n=1 Tax=Herbiconiux solani TaxID=661329 RepID=UPI000824D3EC|nr:hypothetical protein [Herbiconiux solani]